MTCGLGRADWPPRGCLLLLLASMRRFAAFAVSVGAVATVYVAACVLPGEPSGVRIRFSLDSTGPYRVPLAGVAEPLIAISADGQVLKNPSYRLETPPAGAAGVGSTERPPLGETRRAAGGRAPDLRAAGRAGTRVSGPR